MKRLTPQQAADLRHVVKAHRFTLEGKLQEARNRNVVDVGEVSFYIEKLQVVNGLLDDVLPASGGVELDDLADEQLDEDDD